MRCLNCRTTPALCASSAASAAAFAAAFVAALHGAPPCGQSRSIQPCFWADLAPTSIELNLSPSRLWPRYLCLLCVQLAYRGGQEGCRVGSEPKTLMIKKNAAFTEVSHQSVFATVVQLNPSRHSWIYFRVVQATALPEML